jgi:hypothetical protein
MPEFDNEEEVTPEVTQEIDPLAAFIGAASEVASVPEGATFIKIVTSGGEPRFVPTSVPLTVSAVISQSGLYLGGTIEYWMGGAKVGSDTIVPVGETLSVVASVKGGR